MSIRARYEQLDAVRTDKLDRARKCAELTLPQILPPVSYGQQDGLPVPNQSLGSSGVTSLAAKMLSAMLPVGGTPFFQVVPADGSIPEPEVANYLERLSYQIHRKLMSKNLRDTLFVALQHLIVSGDVLMMFHDSFEFNCVRLDHFVVNRDAVGNVKEVIYLEFIEDEEYDDSSFHQSSLSVDNGSVVAGYKTKYCRFLHDDDTNTWTFEKEFDGDIIDQGTFEVAPFAITRWCGVAGEDYGRSKCEEMIGDLISFDAYSEALNDCLAAASKFYIGINPNGAADIDDIEDMPNGGFIAARGEDLFTFSPSNTMNNQINSMAQAVETLRREVGRQFLIGGASVRDAERVTAAEVSMLASELENVLGGAFSAIARELLGPVVSRAFYLMAAAEEIDPRLSEQFSDDSGSLSMEVVTGLNAMSRDSDLSKLMQLGQVIQTLPPEAAQRFRYSEYAESLVTALGFDARQWVISDEEIAQMEQAKQQAAMEQAAQQQIMQQASGIAGAAAQQDLIETGGEGIDAAMQNLNQMPPQ